LLAGFNESASPDVIKTNLIKMMGGEQNEELVALNSKTSNAEETKVSHDFEYVRIQTNPKVSSELKVENYIFIHAPRNYETFLEHCKVADIVCVCMSAKDCELN